MPVEKAAPEIAHPPLEVSPTIRSTSSVSDCAEPLPPYVSSLGGKNGQLEPNPSCPYVPGYEVLGQLGEGGMGIVYKAYQVSLKRLVALKMIRATHVSYKIRERFRLEAESVGRLQHPNIVQIHEVGEHNGCPFFSLEYVEGGSLNHYLDGRPVDARSAARLLLTLARAVQFAHDKGIVHRDLKPANILLQKTGTTNHTKNTKYDLPPENKSPSADFSYSFNSRDSWFNLLPKIADFGLAKQLDEDDRLSRDGDVLGTPNYMSPEQAAGSTKDIGPRTDVYALGAILYELLTGRPLFLSPCTEETLRLVRETDPVPPRQLLRARLPRDLDTICLKCLNKQPAKRYSSAAALAEDLNRFLNGEAIQARPIGPLERAAKWGRRHPARATFFSCLLLALGALAVAIPINIHLLRTEVLESKEEILRLHRENLRQHVQALLVQGRTAQARDEWHEARLRYTEVLDNLDAHPETIDFDLQHQRDEAQSALANVDRRLAAKKAAQERQRNFRELFRWRDEALFLLHRDLFTPSAASPDESAEAAQRGLALFGMSKDGLSEPRLQGYVDAEKEQLRGVLHELLLIRAEAVARPRAGQTNSQRAERAGEALALLDRAARISADAATVQRRRARYLRQCGQIAEAERAQRRADSLRPQTALGWFLLGCDLGLDEPNRARTIQAFDEALRIRADLFWAHFFRALAYQKQGHPREARASLTVCVSQRDDFAWNHLLRGLILIELGDLSAARADFDKAETLPLDVASRYVLHLNRGTLALKKSQTDEAIHEFKLAAQGKPDTYQAYVNLAEAYGQRNQLKSAIRWLDRAIEAAPDNPNLYRSRALFEQRRQRPQNALADLENAIRLTPDNGPSLELARYHFERGAILFLEKRFRDALRAFDASLGVDGKLPAKSNLAERERLRANTHLLRAQALLQMQDYKAARAAFDDYLKKATPTANVWRQRAATSLKLDDYKSVLEDCTKALALEQDAKTFYLRGCAYLNFDLPKLAVRDFDEAAKQDAKYPEAFAWRGLCRVKLGEIARAIEDARMVVKLSPKSPEARWWAARIFARAAQAQRDPDYETEALRLLRQAGELIRDPQQRATFWRDKVRNDRTLTSLTVSAEFRALDQRFAAPNR
jgi:serine/threonine protein kinase/tetratricopeptide (TPR) repeat protein